MDRCLLAYMAILLAQSAYSLFSAAALGTETGGIDIIVRTSTAAVFGYFLSANYRLEAAPGEDDPDNSLQVVTTAGIGLFCLLTLLDGLKDLLFVLNLLGQLRNLFNELPFLLADLLQMF